MGIVKVTELERTIARAYKPAVHAMAERAKTLAVDLPHEMPSIVAGNGQPVDPSTDRIEVAALDRLIPGPRLSPEGDPDFLKIGNVRVPVEQWRRALPVGQYGLPLTMALAEAYALRCLPGMVPEEIFPAQLYFQGKGIRRNIADSRMTSMFGVFAILQSAAHLTAYKVAGFDNGFDLLRSIPPREFTRLSTRVPVMVLGPMANKGFFLPGPVLEPTGSGTTRISQELLDFLDGEKEIYKSDQEVPADAQQVERSKDHSTATRGCPVDFEELVAPVLSWVVRRHVFTSARAISYSQL
jgi:hypothetical protein